MLEQKIETEASPFTSISSVDQTPENARVPQPRNWQSITLASERRSNQAHKPILQASSKRTSPGILTEPA